MKKAIVIHFPGRHKPGLTTLLTAILAEYHACVLDIGQAVVHETLALGLLIEIPQGDSLAPLEKELIAKSDELELKVRFTPIEKPALDHWLSAQGKDRFIITILGRAISAHHLSRVSRIIADHGLNVDRIERLSGRLSLALHSSGANACIGLRARARATCNAAIPH